MKTNPALLISPTRTAFLFTPLALAWCIVVFLLPPAASGADTFTGTGSLITARDRHTATLLPNGEVLVAAGSGPNGPVLSSAELYNPSSGTWSATGSLAIAREEHTATLLPSGKVLVAGGYDDITGSFSSAELYDPASGTWSATGSLVNARGAHTATLLPNGKVLVAGGEGTGTYLSSAELYDPASGTWSATGSLANAREAHTATLLPNGKVLVAGGYDGITGALSSAELYDPASGTWTATGSLATARAYYTATLLPNGQVLVAGGGNNSGWLASAELYDPASGMWTATGSLATARDFHTATLLSNGQMLVAGGAGNGYSLASAELYDPAVGTWTVTGSLANARVEHTATLLPSGNVLVAGGAYYAGSAISSAELYSPAPYTFGPQVVSPTGLPNMTYNSGTGTFQYTDTANSTDDSAYVPLTGTAAALITTATGWTTTLTVNLSARSMTAVGTSVDPSNRISIGVGTSNLQNFVGMQLVQVDYTGSVNSEVPNNFYGTAVEFGARTNGADAAPTPLGTSQLGVKNGVTHDCYQVLSGGTSSTPSTESISAANGILTLIYTTASNTVTGYYNGAPVGSFSLAGWGSNPALTLFVLGASGEGVAVPAGTATATAFYVAGPVAISPNPANLAENASQITITGTGFDPIAGNNTVTFSDGAVGTVTAATATSLTVSLTTDPTGLGNLTAVVTTDGHSSGAAVLVATVTPPVYAITVSASPPADGTASGGGSFNTGASVTVTATPNAGYTFVNWTVNGTVVSKTASYMFTASANESLVANFSTGIPAMPNWGWVVLSGMLLFLAGRHLPARRKCSS